MKLYIGNKNYSSWSFRVWLTLTVKGIPFVEDLRPFDVENDYADFFEFAPHGKVPVLEDGGLTVWESLAILEYVAEKFSEKQLWPSSQQARAHARSVSSEMHSGFMALRSACPMNMRRRHAPLDVNRAVRKDVGRIEELWAECIENYGGPFLFGQDFSIADGMFAPVVNRLRVYQLSEHPSVIEFSETMMGLPEWRAWQDASAKEPWTVDIDEV